MSNFNHSLYWEIKGGEEGSSLPTWVWDIDDDDDDGGGVSGSGGSGYSNVFFFSLLFLFLFFFSLSTVFIWDFKIWESFSMGCVVLRLGWNLVCTSSLSFGASYQSFFSSNYLSSSLRCHREWVPTLDLASLEERARYDFFVFWVFL